MKKLMFVLLFALVAMIGYSQELPVYISLGKYTDFTGDVFEVGYNTQRNVYMVINEIGTYPLSYIYGDIFINDLKSAFAKVKEWNEVAKANKITDVTKGIKKYYSEAWLVALDEGYKCRQSIMEVQFYLASKLPGKVFCVLYYGQDKLAAETASWFATEPQNIFIDITQFDEFLYLFSEENLERVKQLHYDANKTQQLFS